MSKSKFYFAFGAYGIISQSGKLLVIRKMVDRISIVLIYLVAVFMKGNH
ncbi:hypothetical protein [Companilactobacillus kimchiensis]|nr:hypothetical protein [Companilactobacillus kimchiensis]